MLKRAKLVKADEAQCKFVNRHAGRFGNIHDYAPTLVEDREERT